MTFLKSQIFSVFMDVKTNTAYFRTHYYAIAFYNPDGKCLQRGTEFEFMLILIFTNLIPCCWIPRYCKISGIATARGVKLSHNWNLQTYYANRYGSKIRSMAPRQHW